MGHYKAVGDAGNFDNRKTEDSAVAVAYLRPTCEETNWAGRGTKDSSALAGIHTPKLKSQPMRRRLQNIVLVLIDWKTQRSGYALLK
ncbi:Hypothetical predicted protein [Pelobates cultripes]|uniref:Uncharacterized protein n=1 Tax=Pelobates cultripes TaxID=61616 RepID=A0AAD1R146_PELCU|nr:Hypothetical predicted protein [Pelobates cultripes]